MCTGKVDAYEDEANLWREDHRLAMQYFTVQDLVNEGIDIFKQICHVDEEWRSALFEGSIEYDEDFDNNLIDLLKRFSRVSNSILNNLIPSVESAF
ncbi:MAG: hypothetical protein R3C28_05105 [Pirellulaceae bacterium]